MPLISNSDEVFGGRILLWQLDEDEHYTEPIINTAHKFLDGITHPLRRIQRLATCALLQQIGTNTASSLYYDDHGKPWIKDPEGHISISHSRRFAGLYYHPNKQVGIDIEERGSRISRVAPRFLHPENEKWASQDEYYQLQVWCAKEAAFKAIGGGGIDFKQELHVEHPGDEGRGLIHYQGIHGKWRFQAKYQDLEAALLVYTIAERDGSFTLPTT